MDNNSLSPAQRKLFEQTIALLSKSSVVGVVARGGCGRTTVLRQLAAKLNAHFIRLADVFGTLSQSHPLKFEESLADTLLRACSKHKVVIVDDFHVYHDLLEDHYSGPRPGILHIALDAVLRLLEDSGHKLIMGLRNDETAEPLHKRCLFAEMPSLEVEDLAFLTPRITGDTASELDFERILRFSPRITAQQIQQVGAHLDGRRVDTDAFLNHLEKYGMVSNVKTEEVDDVSLEHLKGVDELIKQLEVDIILPMERSDLARDIGIKPKRGVLIYGPPGTGKTSIGRALAHRLRSKFFLIDGAVISGTSNFYMQIQRVFASAKANAPSIIFFDDCDLLFENEEDTALYRYLLTMLDGLQSKDSGLVTVMLTAMNIGSLPPALIRSGRVELWLEMNLPDLEARSAIISGALEKCPESLRSADVSKIAAQTRELSGADIKRVVADAINLYGFDVASEQPVAPPLTYFERAVGQLRKYRRQLETAPLYTAAHHGGRLRGRIGFLGRDDDEG